MQLVQHGQPVEHGFLRAPCRALARHAPARRIGFRLSPEWDTPALPAARDDARRPPCRVLARQQGLAPVLSANPGRDRAG